MRKWMAATVLAFGLLCAAPGWLLAAAARDYVPGIKIVFEVRTPQGDLRSFQRPGSPPTYWAQDMPVVKGDQVTINPLISTGKAELGEVKIRLDNRPLSVSTQPPWRIQVDSAALEPGYHLVEVWAATKGPGSRENTVSTSFLVVPQNDPLLQVLKPETQPALPVTDEERLSATLRALDPKLDQQILRTSRVEITQPSLFFVSAGPAAKEFFFTISRDGQVTYTSSRLPLPTHILLEPARADGQGQAPGEIILTVRVGDGEGRFGPPAWITVKIAPGEQGK